MEHNPSPDPKVEIIPVITPETDATTSATPAMIETSTTDGGDIAESYVRNELRDAKKSLRLTQLASLLIVLGTAAYMGYMTWQGAAIRPARSRRPGRQRPHRRTRRSLRSTGRRLVQNPDSPVHVEPARPGDCRRAAVAPKHGLPGRNSARKLLAKVFAAVGRKHRRVFGKEQRSGRHHSQAKPGQKSGRCS